LKLSATNRDFLLNANEFGNFVNHLILDQSAVHIEDDQTLVTTEDAFLLKDHLDVPFALEPPYALVFAKVVERKILGVRRRGESNLDDARLIILIQTAMRGIHALVRRREGFHNLEEIGQTQLGDERTVQMVEWLRLRSWRLPWELLNIDRRGGSHRNHGGRELIRIWGRVRMEMRMNGIGGLVDDSCYQFWSSSRKGICLMIENGVNNAAFSDLFRIGADGINMEIRERL
jgi:hypothetical protein